MAGYVGTKAVLLSTTAATVGGAASVGAGLTVDNDGSTVLTVDRATSDGTIIDVQKSGSSVGSIQSLGGRMLMGTSDCNLFFNNLATRIEPRTGNGSLSDGSIDMGVSNSRFKDLYLSGGVYLGGTGSANKLDDYEEGNWTPVIEGNSPVGTGTYNLQYGSYVKVGNLVTANCYVRCTSHTGGGSQIRIGGFPFTVASGADQYGVPSFGEITTLTKMSDTVVSGYMMPTDNRMMMIQISTTSYGTSYVMAFDVAFSVLFTVTYQAS